MAIENFLRKIDEDRCFDDLAQLTLFDRIQLSDGLEKSMDWIVKRLNEDGIEARKELIDHPGSIEGYKVPDGWMGRGTIYLDGVKMESRLIRRSKPLEEGFYDLVTLADGTSLSDYEGVDVEGKIIITDKNPLRIAELACGKLNATAVISDWVQEKCDDPSAIAYTSFFEEEKSGFMISRKVGKKIRRGKKVECHITSAFSRRKIPVAVAEVGEGEEEVIGIAHVCHPKHEANDNASGASLLMEIARSLPDNVKRKVRMLWVPEMLGTIAYFQKHDVKAVAGLNLDMVGEDQFLCKSPLLIERPPFLFDSRASDLLISIMDKIKTEKALGAVHSLGNEFYYPLFMSYSTPFSGGSDHVILADLSIPTPMLIHWPDRYYHTSLDTLDKVSREELKRVGVLSCEYLLRMAQMEEDKLPRLIEFKSHFRGKTYVRRYRQPFYRLKDKEYFWEKKKFFWSSTPNLAIMLLDGKRSVDDIIRILSINGVDPGEVREYFQMLEGEEIIEPVE